MLEGALREKAGSRVDVRGNIHVYVRVERGGGHFHVEVHTKGTYQYQ